MNIQVSRLLSIIDKTIGDFQLLRIEAQNRRAGKPTPRETIDEIESNLRAIGLHWPAQHLHDSYNRFFMTLVEGFKANIAKTSDTIDNALLFIRIGTHTDEVLGILKPVKNQLEQHFASPGGASPAAPEKPVLSMLCDESDRKAINTIAHLSRGLFLEVLDAPSANNPPGIETRSIKWKLQEWIPSFLVEIELGKCADLDGTLYALEQAGYLWVKRVWFGLGPHTSEFMYTTSRGDAWLIKRREKSVVLTQAPKTEFSAIKELLQPVDFVRLTESGWRHATTVIESKTSEKENAVETKRPIPTEGELNVWNALDRRAMTSPQIVKFLRNNGVESSPQVVKEHIVSLRSKGYDIPNKRGRGYYRPDALPPDVAAK